jgi:hypothetical protein
VPVTTSFTVVAVAIPCGAVQGADTFVFGAASDSTMTAPDWIMDFTSGLDKIDLSGIAGFATGAASLNFVSGFTGHAGDAILTYFAQTNQTSLMVDLTGRVRWTLLWVSLGKRWRLISLRDA